LHPVVSEICPVTGPQNDGEIEMTNGPTAEVVGQLRANAVAFEKSAVYPQIVGPRDEVLSRFQPIFSTDRSADVPQLHTGNQ
jgi:hypothetical protein